MGGLVKLALKSKLTGTVVQDILTGTGKRWMKDGCLDPVHGIGQWDLPLHWPHHSTGGGSGGRGGKRPCCHRLCSDHKCFREGCGIDTSTSFARAGDSGTQRNPFDFVPLPMGLALLRSLTQDSSPRTDEREAVQKKTFTKWVNSHLARKSCRITDLYKDLRDGQMLIKLLEVLSGEMLVRLPAGRGPVAGPSPFRKDMVWGHLQLSWPSRFLPVLWEVFIQKDVRCPRGWLGSQSFLPPLASASLHASPGSHAELLTFSTWDRGGCGWSAMARPQPPCAG